MVAAIPMFLQLLCETFADLYPSQIYEVDHRQEILGALPKRRELWIERVSEPAKSPKTTFVASSSASKINSGVARLAVNHDP